MTKSKLGIVAILIAVIALGVVVFRSGEIREVEIPVGGQFNELNHKTFFEGLTTEGLATFDAGILQSSTFATSSAGTATYTASNITGITSLLHNATGAVTVTLPATTTLASFVPNTGDRVSILVANVGTGILTLAGGTGSLLTSASSSLAVSPSHSALLEVVRKANTDIAFSLIGN